jgi:MFS family permease
MITTFRSTLNRFSPKFWVLVGSQFIDALGSTMAFPFFSLYITHKFGVGMAEAGVLLGIFSVSGFVGRIIGGALADRFGRRNLVLFGVIFSALSSVAFGVVSELAVFYVLAVVVGLLSFVAGPAYGAMVADLLPEEQRAEGFGILRVTHNLAWVVGPMIGGFLIGYSYLYVFIGDAIASLIVAGIFYKMMPETKPERKEGEAPEALSQSFLGYFKVAKDWLFVAFTIAMVFNWLAYQQVYSTLPVFLRDFHGIPESGYGYLMSANAFTVVVLQFWVTSKVSKKQPMLMMALGVVLYMIGLVMYGVVSTYALFLVAMMIITVGEMVSVPVSQALVAKFAPEQMRGRYMAFYSLSTTISSAVGPAAAGLILDNYNPNLLWYLCGLSCLVAVGMFLMLNKQVEGLPQQAPEKAAGKAPDRVPEMI